MERKHQLLLIGLIGVLLLAAIAWFNFGPGRSGTGLTKGRGAFAEPSPTPKPNARQKADAAGQISHANEAAQGILGLPLEQLRGRTMPQTHRGALRPDGSELPLAQRPSHLA